MHFLGLICIDEKAVDRDLGAYLVVEAHDVVLQGLLLRVLEIVRLALHWVST